MRSSIPQPKNQHSKPMVAKLRRSPAWPGTKKRRVWRGSRLVIWAMALSDTDDVQRFRATASTSAPWICNRPLGMGVIIVSHQLPAQGMELGLSNVQLYDTLRSHHAERKGPARRTHANASLIVVGCVRTIQENFPVRWRVEPGLHHLVRRLRTALDGFAGT